MYEYITGLLEQLNITEAIIDNNGIGYKLQISLNTYSSLQGLGEVKLFVHHIVREDDEQLYGFYTQYERTIFALLISVSGIGPNTARMMLSSMTPEEISEAIISENVTKIKSIKGIGVKTAQRVVIDLKDKLVKGASASDTAILSGNISKFEEAQTALTLLGFNKSAVEKVLHSIVKENKSASLEELIKLALKQL